MRWCCSFALAQSKLIRTHLVSASSWSTSRRCSMEAGRESVDKAGDGSRAVSLLMRRRRRLLSISSSDSQQHCNESCFVGCKMCTTRTSHNCPSARHKWAVRRSVARCCCTSPPAGCRASVAVYNVECYNNSKLTAKSAKITTLKENAVDFRSNLP